MQSEKIEYDALRQEFRPDRVRVLLIAEAPPRPAKHEEPRFFYQTGPERADYLFLEIMSVLFFNLTAGVPGERDSGVRNRLRCGKVKFLKAFRRHEFWLIDAVSEPFTSDDASSKRLAVEQNAARVCRIANSASPEGCVLIKKSVFHALASHLKEIGLEVWNDGSLPFPSTGHAHEFRSAFAKLLVSHCFRLPLSVDD